MREVMAAFTTDNMERRLMAIDDWCERALACCADWAKRDVTKGDNRVGLVSPIDFFTFLIDKKFVFFVCVCMCVRVYVWRLQTL